MLSHKFKEGLPLAKELSVSDSGMRSTVILREFTQDDISSDYIGWLNNKDLVRFSNQRFMTHDESSCRDFFTSVNRSNSVFLAIEYEAPGVTGSLSTALVGTMTVHFNQHHGTADMGILVGEPSVTGLGVASAAWGMAMNHALAIPEVRKVTAGTLSCNQPMLGVIRKSGMQPDGIRVDQELVEGVAFDMLHFARFSDSTL